MTMKTGWVAVPVLTVLLAAPPKGRAQQTAMAPADGATVIRRMHDRYAGQWYPHLTFRQRSDFYAEGAVSRTETWYEALSVPGRLRISIGDVSGKNGILFRADSQYVYQEGALAAARPTIHPLLVLGFDVYGQSPERTVEQLRRLGMKLDQVGTTSDEGHTYWRVGDADEGGEFWIDPETLTFDRLIRVTPAGARTVTRFLDYEQMAGGWVAKRVEFTTDGALTLVETYHDLETPPSLPAAIYQPSGSLSADVVPWTPGGGDGDGR
jgi:hypothetical protein